MKGADGSVQGQRRLIMYARKIGRTRSQSYTLDYDVAGFNQVKFLTMSNVYILLNDFLALSPLSKFLARKIPEVFRCHHSDPTECLDGAPRAPND